MKARSLALLASLGLWAIGPVGAEPALTVYNQGFALVRQDVTLELRQGVNEIRLTDITAHAETESVVLRDPAGQRALQILEQNYRAEPVSQELLLSLNEGKMLDFLVKSPQGEEKVIQGKVIRSGYVPHRAAWQRYGQEYAMRQQGYTSGGGGTSQPMIEINGKIQFNLPGTPLFPPLADDAVLKPTMQWLLESATAGPLVAELSYITGGMQWDADYNLVEAGEKDRLDLTAWVTIDNQSGKDFAEARIKLMAGDVSKIQRRGDQDGVARMRESSMGMGGSGTGGPPVTEKSFDEYHLYALARPTTLHDRETKQVEFVRAARITSERLYIYDGAKIDWQRYRGSSMENIRRERDYGTLCNPKVWVMREFQNTEANHLGMPLPRGQLRFYRRDDDGRLEFTGENLIDHTPKDERVRVYTGNAFDLVGERKRTNYKEDSNRQWLDESFEITLRSHKTEAAEVRVVEHLYRWLNWEITEKTNTFLKTDAQTMEFRLQLKPDEEQTITYTVHYSW
jgi:hypothetical protein